MPNISIADATYQRLLKRAISFEDSPEDVIVRLLDEGGDSGGTTPHRDSPAGGQPSRATPGSVLPIRGYWVPILRALVEAGGSAASTDVIEALGTSMQDVLTPRDFEPLRSGETRWRNRARFARLRMKERGLLSHSSDRGVWEITALGRKYLEAEEPDK